MKLEKPLTLIEFLNRYPTQYFGTVAVIRSHSERGGMVDDDYGYIIQMDSSQVNSRNKAIEIQNDIHRAIEFIGREWYNML